MRTKGDVLGMAVVSFFAASRRDLDCCAVHWDGDADLICVLPSLALDEWLPGYKRIDLDTDAGPGLIVGGNAQLVVVSDIEARLDELEAQSSVSGPEVTFGDLPIMLDPPGQLIAETEFTVKLHRRRARLWAESRTSPPEAESAVWGLGYRLLWDWVVGGSLGADRRVMVTAMRTQCRYYCENGMPNVTLRQRDTGLATFVAWARLPNSPLDAYLE